jgi:hypothetical protein
MLRIFFFQFLQENKKTKMIFEAKRNCKLCSALCTFLCGKTKALRSKEQAATGAKTGQGVLSCGSPGLVLHHTLNLCLSTAQSKSTDSFSNSFCDAIYNNKTSTKDDNNLQIFRIRNIKF